MKRGNQSFRYRMVLGCAVIVLFGAAAAQALPPAGPPGGNKVDICHIPPGNPTNWHTITVSESALPAHLSHGDLEGTCLENCETLCSDGDACTQDVESDVEECVCLPQPTPVDCDDSNPCTFDSCSSEIGACVYDPTILDGTSCDDGDPATVDDVCSAGVCAGQVPIVCDGGHQSGPGAWPWVLSLQRFDGSDWRHVCGATLLGSTRALTAASCVFGQPAGDFRIVAGLYQRSDLTGTQTSAVSSLTVHPSYTGADPGLTFDLAILNLATAISTGGNVAFALLPPDNSDDFAGDTATLTGWGETALALQIPNDELQQDALGVISNAECDDRFSDEGLSGAIGAGHLCSFSDTVDPCTGDVGGPVQVPDGFGGYYVAGVQSWPVDYVVPYSSASSVPRVATRVSAFLAWIGSN